MSLIVVETNVGKVYFNPKAIISVHETVRPNPEEQVKTTLIMIDDVVLVAHEEAGGLVRKINQELMRPDA